MSDSPRWHLDGLPGTTGIVEVMLYDDHVAAVAESFAAGVKAARDAVAAHIRSDLTQQEMFSGRKSGLLAAIDALTNGQKEA